MPLMRRLPFETKEMTNETQSPVLASFLGEFRTEMREYAMPAYPKYLQGKLDVADKKVQELEAELAKKEKAKAKAKANDSSKEKDTGAEKKQEQMKTKAPAKIDAETDAAKEVAQKAGETWAISFFANVAMLAVIFAMASAKDQVVKNYTWFLIDQVVCIFLAVMYFNAFDSMLDFNALGLENIVLASVCHAFCMLIVVVGAAMLLRKKRVAMAILCGAGAHIVSFSSIHAAASVQVKWLSWSYTFSMCIFGLSVLALGLAVIGYLVFTAKRRAQLTDDDDYMDKTDDVENDFGSMAFSVVFTMFVRFLITGHHPADDETEFDHDSADRFGMFIWAVMTILIAGFVVKYCSEKAAEADYAKKRVLTFCSTVAAMNVAWAWLYWGEWEFFETLYPGEAVKGRVMFAITMTMVGGLGLLVLSKVRADAKGDAMASEKKVMLTALGLVIAWSWELCFDAAVEDMCDGVSHPVRWKVGATLALFAIVIPVYGIYMRPITELAAQAIGA